METLGQKICLQEHREREIILSLKRRHFANPGDNSGFFCSGGQPDLIIRFTTNPEEETGPVSGLFFHI
jgi:hypothetical protein